MELRKARDRRRADVRSDDDRGVALPPVARRDEHEEKARRAVDAVQAPRGRGVDGGAGTPALTDVGTRGASASDRAEASREDTAPQPASSPDPLEGFLARLDGVPASAAAFDDEREAAAARARATTRSLSFDLGPETYAVHILDIREIIKMTPVTPVPRAPHGVLGVMSKRGVVLPIVDLPAVLGRRPVRPEVLADQRVLVVGVGEQAIGLRVDRVHGVVELAEHDIGPMPQGVSTDHAPFYRGLARQAGELFVLLDLGAFVAHLASTPREGARS